MVRPSLNDLAAFAAVASHQSFRRAADIMGVSRSALSHAIIGLEAKLDVRLLNRTTRSVSLTQAGARLLARLDPVLQELDQALDTLSEERGTPSGTLRINANKSGSRILLAEVVPRFLDLYPDVELDLVSEGRLVDIVEQGFDAGIRLLETVPKDMVAVKFGGDVRFIAVAAPSYLDGKARPHTPDDLYAHCCVRQRLPSGKRYRWEFSKRGAEVAIDVPGNLTLDDNDLLVQAAADGRGIAYVPEYFAQPFLGSGQLVTVLDDWCPPTPGLALYYPRSRHVPSPLRAFIDLLREVDRTR
ncbi:LysR family transcriptional regulator [Rhizobium leguminosarum bv. viciae]|uniref:HTH-type transcriptional regulator TtuA n=1 Tax=Rhizobium leguminosarum bv. viciae TaxID=387 RepID=A0A8I2KN10_RHILV|nr:LysR family transcriptional regulator [Rhizobium leguminosarum]NKM15835.1 LysR family transcriptional regulator [Rhizobium laguerreae]MBY5754204.1 LysR family transcriptional regulator [Rhizobium leguminosarum]MBY5774697.1 LysR family transcriptional regulator [Rhizobium leguminosarum]MBY5795160.1 LysR family transcriptional regulator [Rhizobium leguminosarum]MBY5795501.1 LysR family transcriptional regulator [Rhizobium leguminosarum]